jgi:hypothetical protein
LKDNTFAAIRFLIVLREGYILSKSGSTSETFTTISGLNIDFPYEKNLHDKIFNHKNFKIALVNEAVPKFPKEHIGIKDVISFIYEVTS